MGHGKSRRREPLMRNGLLLGDVFIQTDLRLERYSSRKVLPNIDILSRVSMVNLLRVAGVHTSVWSLLFNDKVKLLHLRRVLSWTVSGQIHCGHRLTAQGPGPLLE